MSDIKYPDKLPDGLDDAHFFLFQAWWVKSPMFAAYVKFDGEKFINSPSRNSIEFIFIYLNPEFKIRYITKMEEKEFQGASFQDCWSQFVKWCNGVDA